MDQHSTPIPASFQSASETAEAGTQHRDSQMLHSQGCECGFSLDRLCGEREAEATLLPVGKQAMGAVGFLHQLEQRLLHLQCVSPSLLVSGGRALGSDFDAVDVAGAV